MKKNFLIPIGLMLFALFFGAGNLIFPVYMGQNAGVNTIPATLGFLLTGVGFPILAVAAIGDTVYAAFSGRIRLTKYERSGYGFYVIVRHENSLQPLASHRPRRELLEPSDDRKNPRVLA